MAEGWTLWVSELGRVALGTLAGPLLVWTSLAAGLVLLLTVASGLHPLVQERVRTTVLLALPVAVVLAAAEGSGWIALPRQPVPLVSDWLGQSSETWTRAVSAAGTQGKPTAGEESPPTFPPTFWLGGVLLSSLLASAGMAVRWGLGRLALERLRRRLRPLALENLPESGYPLGELPSGVTLTRVDEDVPPMTFGTLRPVVVVPERLLEEPDVLRLVLEHEVAHIRRRDSLVGSVEHLVALLFAIHPLVHLLRSHIGRYREMACDAEVLARTRCRAREYASVLLRLSEPLPPTEPTLALTGSFAHLKERITTMSAYEHDAATLTRASRTCLALGASVLLVTVGAVACSDLVTDPPVDAQRAEAVVGASDVEAAFENARRNFDGRLLVYFRGDDPADNAPVEELLLDNPRYARLLDGSFAQLSLPVTSPEALTLMERFRVTSHVATPLLMVVRGDRAVLMTTLSEVDSEEAAARKMRQVTESVASPASGFENLGLTTVGSEWVRIGLGGSPGMRLNFDVATDGEGGG